MCTVYCIMKYLFHLLYSGRVHLHKYNMAEPEIKRKTKCQIKETNNIEC